MAAAKPFGTSRRKNSSRTLNFGQLSPFSVLCTFCSLAGPLQLTRDSLILLEVGLFFFTVSESELSILLPLASLPHQALCFARFGMPFCATTSLSSFSQPWSIQLAQVPN